MARKSGSRGQAQVKWTLSMKLAVNYIHSEHNLAKNERTAVFNRIFAAELAASGIPEGVSANVVSAQWGERNKTNPDWIAIRHLESEAIDAHARDSMRRRVQQAVERKSGESTPSGNVGENTTSSTPAHSIATTTTPRGRAGGNATTTQFLASPSASNDESPTDVFMSMTLQDRPSTVASSSTRPQYSFREALSRAAYTSPATPSPSPSKKQTVTSTGRKKRSFNDGSDDDDDYSPSSKRVASRQRTAVVMVPRTPLAAGSRRTATFTKSPAEKPPRVPTTMNNGKTIMLTKRQAETRTTRSQPVDKYRAHPPMKGLLFRVWEEDPDCKRDSRQGHCARKYWRKNAVPNDPPTTLDPTDVLNHMDREMTDGPFISTCSRLVWTIHLMLKYLKQGKTSCRVSVINAAALDQRCIFHARPYHDDLVKMAAFTNGAWHYHGSHEYLIFKQIPAEAIVNVFRAQDLVKVATDVEAIGRALQFEILRVSHQSLTCTKIPTMKKNAVALSQEITGGVAELCAFLGLDAHSAVDHLSHIVTDVVEGWALSVENREEEQWYQLATVFARRLCQLSPQPISFKEQETAKFAFLNGVAWGCGDPNAAHKPELVAQKQRKATAAGLASPAQICANALDAAKLSILAFEKAQNTRHSRYHQQRLLHDSPGNRSINLRSDDRVNIEIDMDGEIDGGSDEENMEADESDDEIMFTDNQLGL